MFPGLQQPWRNLSKDGLTFRTCRGMLVMFSAVVSFRVTLVMASSKHDTAPIMRRKESSISHRSVWGIGIVTFSSVSGRYWIISYLSPYFVGAIRKFSLCDQHSFPPNHYPPTHQTAKLDEWQEIYERRRLASKYNRSCFSCYKQHRQFKHTIPRNNFLGAQFQLIVWQTIFRVNPL